ncbi:hypothetical protein [Prochlorococcus sp. MIT 1201]|uniref:hypothetical protein n=1 Tax=Prochlorococcus sp. MIT 1201 TaxID=3082535 RepID=UPI0039A445EB
MTDPKEPKDEGKVELSDEDLEGVDGGVGGEGGTVLDPLTGELLNPGEDGLPTHYE